jgi:uncharacterized small protein (DUF1192 family)
MQHDNRRAQALADLRHAVLSGETFPGDETLLRLLDLTQELNSRVIALQENIDRLERRSGT